MGQLVSMELRTLPVTLVCAGNRRKEVNVTRQSKGFSWGPAAVSTSIWTGVPLHALLKRCGIDVDKAGRDSWVSFDGPDAELPKGTYGTSIPLWRAMDPAADVIVAFEQNGEKLKPDHGFPIRIIIPGKLGWRPILEAMHSPFLLMEWNDCLMAHSSSCWLPSNSCMYRLHWWPDGEVVDPYHGIH